MPRQPKKTVTTILSTSTPRRTQPLKTLPLVAAATLLCATTTAWWMDRTQPITPNQRATLTAYVDAAARRQGRSKQAVWAGLHRRLNTPRADQIHRHQMDDAIQYLQQ